MRIAHAFNSTITPQVEWKKSTKRNKSRITTTSLGMEINGSKEADFNFDMKKTFNLEDSSLDAPMGRCESRPKHASQMALNALDASTSNGTLSPNEGSLTLESNSKERDIATTILNDDHPQPESMEQQPSNSTCQGGVLDKKNNVASLLEMQLIKT
jgi:hypothetical protein